MDTGAVRSIASGSLVRRCKLDEYQQKYVSLSRLSGIDGGANISTFLKGVTLHFTNMFVNLDLPIV